MNRQIKKIIAGICAVLMIFGTVATIPADVISNAGIGIVASAEVVEGDFGENNSLHWSYDSELKTLTISGIGAIPDYTQTDHSKPWDGYLNNGKTTSIVVGEGITSIGSYAFEHTYTNMNVESVTLPSTVKTLGDCSFMNLDKLTSINIPEGVTSIGDNCLRGLTNLSNIELPSTLTKIGQNCFKLSGIKKIVIPKSVTLIDNWAFWECSSLETVTILNTEFENIGTDVFNKCTSLENIFVTGAASETQYDTIVGALKRAGVNSNIISQLSHNYDSNHICTICGQIGGYCGAGTDDEKKSLEWSYNSTTGVLTISGTGTAMEDYSYSKDVPWNSYVSDIKSVVFDTDNLTNIGDYAFCGCNNENFIIVAFPEKVKTIGNYAFRYSGLTSVTIPESVETIGKGAFEVCTSLATVDLSKATKLTTIEAHAFDQCRNESFTSVTIPRTVTTLGNRAFANCTNIKTVQMLNPTLSLSNDSNNQFYGDKALTTFTLGCDATADQISTAKTALEARANTKGVTVEKLDHSYNANNECTVCGYIGGTCGENLNWKLEKIGATSNYKLTISGTGTTMDDYINVLNNAPWSAYESFIKSVDFDTDNLTNIGDYAFFCCDSTEFNEVEIPKTVATIGELAFAGCSYLTTVTLPDETNLTTIGDSAFESCTSLETVDLSKATKLTTIGDSAFEACTSLATVDLSKATSLTKIGESAFLGCNNSSFTSVTIPRTVTTLGNKAFAGCTNLKDVEMLNPTLTLSNNSSNPFNGDTALTTFKLGCNATADQILNAKTALEAQANTKGVTVTKVAHTYVNNVCTVCGQIGGYCGAGTDAEKKSLEWSYKDGVLTISGTGTAMENYSFASTAPWNGYASSIKSVDFTGATALTNIGNYAFYGCYNSNFTNVEIPEKVTTIGEHAFDNCISLETVTLPEGTNLTTIGDSAFYGCTSLKNIDLSKATNLTTIDGGAFEGCTSLETVDLSKATNLKTIGECAFLNCENSKFTSVTIPRTVTTLGNKAFAGCTNLKTVQMLNPTLTLFEDESNQFNGDTALTTFTLGCDATEKKISDAETVLKARANPNGVDVTKLDHSYNASDQCTVCGQIGGTCGATGQEDKLTWVLEDGVLTISGDGTAMSNRFKYNSSITKVIIDAPNLTSIPSNAFDFCTSLKDVILKTPNLTIIESSAFNACSSLKNIDLSQATKLTTIKSNAFFGCGSLETIDLSKATSFNEIGASVFFNSGLKEISLPTSITKIGANAFRNCSSLKNIDLSKVTSLTTIGMSAFYGCNNSSFTSVTIPRTVTELGSCAFAGCANLANVEMLNPKLTLLSGASNQFYGDTNLTTFTLGCNATEEQISTAKTEIKAWASENVTVTKLDHDYDDSHVCKRCQQVGGTCGENLTWTFDEDTGKLTISGTGTAMENYSDSKSVPWNGYASSIKSVVFDADELTNIGDYAFCGCNNKSFTSVTIPSTVEKIGNGAFSNCSNLATVDIEDETELTEIGAGCFESTSLTDVTIPSTVETLGSQAFAGCTKLKNVEMLNPELGLIDGILNQFSGDTALETFKLGCGATEQQITDAETALKNQANKSVVVDKNAHVYDPSTGICICGAHKPGGTIEDTDVEWSIEDGVLYITGSGEMPEMTDSDERYWKASDLKDTFTKVVIDNGITSIGSNVFSFTNVDSVVIPNTVTTIGSGAFDDSKLTSVTIPKSVNVIESGAFAGCKDLANVIIYNPDVVVENGAFNGDDNIVTVYTSCDATAEQCEGLKTRMKDNGSATNLEEVVPFAHDYVDGACVNCGAIDPDSLSQDHKISVGTATVTLSTNSASAGEKVYVTGVPGEKYTVRTKTGKIIATISGSGSFVMPDEEIVIDGDAVTTALMQNAFCKPYVYVCDADMNVVKTFTTKNGNEIKLDCGKENAGKTVTIYEGKKSTKKEYTTVTLDANGKATVAVENGANYTAVIG